jgi:hypothetical protein
MPDMIWFPLPKAYASDLLNALSPTQSPFGRGMMATGAPQKALKELSESKGQYMDSPESVADIPNFLNSFAVE